jgi:hypothetical protein
VHSVYLETTVPSYLAAKPSRDLIVAAHQQITREWWQDARDRFELFVSEAVVARSAWVIPRRRRVDCILLGTSPGSS